MTGAFLKKLLSHLFEIKVEEAPSEVSGKLRVSLIDGRYCLSTSNAVYSNEDDYSSFKTAFEKLQVGKRDIRNALILGYGLGSIPLLLHKKHKVHPRFTAVELDKEVIRLAEKYGYLPVNVAMVQEDAYGYVLNSIQQFDLINADLYVDDVTPSQFEKEEFLLALKNLVAPGGLLLFSRFYNDVRHRQLTDAFGKNVFEKIFSGASAMETQGNMMLVWEKRKS
ncbi:MAG: methyltransferase domain-containing protein [Chitinophagales bacterium]|nr:methyltransferase domain-containing protein [Chitinophagales bacterium]